MALAYDCIAPAGITVIVGGAPAGQMLSINPVPFLVNQKTITGCSAGGGTIGDITRNVKLYMSGKLPLDKVVGRTFKLEGVNEALATMEKGEVSKSVILF